MLLLKVSTSTQPNSAFLSNYFYYPTLGNKMSDNNSQIQFFQSVGKNFRAKNSPIFTISCENLKFFSPNKYISSMEDYENLPLALQERWMNELKQPLQTMADQTLEILKNRQVLFVAGFLSDIHPLGGVCYEKNAKELAKQVGIKYSYISLPSHRSAVENVDKIYHKTMEIFLRNKAPVVLFGHSKGGAEVFFTILKYPELILNGIVDRVVLIQAAIGGSPLANPKSPAMTGLFLIFGNGLRSMIPTIADKNVISALESFTQTIEYLYPNKESDFFEQIVEKISEKIFYVRSSSSQQLKSIFHIAQATSQINLQNLGPNDGIILTEDQKCSCFGTDIGILQSDHFDLALNQGRESKCLLAFTRALLGEIYEKNK